MTGKSDKDAARAEANRPKDGSTPKGYKPDNFSEPDGNAAFHGEEVPANTPDEKDLPEHTAYEK